MHKWISLVNSVLHSSHKFTKHYSPYCRQEIISIVRLYPHTKLGPGASESGLLRAELREVSVPRALRPLGAELGSGAPACRVADARVALVHWALERLPLLQPLFGREAFGGSEWSSSWRRSGGVGCGCGVTRWERSLGEELGKRYTKRDVLL